MKNRYTLKRAFSRTRSYIYFSLHPDFESMSDIYFKRVDDIRWFIAKFYNLGVESYRPPLRRR